MVYTSDCCPTCRSTRYRDISHCMDGSYSLNAGLPGTNDVSIHNDLDIDTCHSRFELW